MDFNHRAFISIGSNLGNKRDNCLRAIEALTSGGDIRIRERSTLYRTEPVDFRDQDWFVNGVILVETELGPLDLLDRLQSVQRQAGRRGAGLRYGPRGLDLDILLYDELILEDPRLNLPHPRMHRRRFVLKPLCDIDPEVLHPLLGRTARELLAATEEAGQQVVKLE
jgi:2-amino-4-hydroxy-6-hydroxymethyldihydropteridine diphosphokinase